jgi:hypothetical protein
VNAPAVRMQYTAVTGGAICACKRAQWPISTSILSTQALRAPLIAHSLCLLVSRRILAAWCMAGDPTAHPRGQKGAASTQHT